MIVWAGNDDNTDVKSKDSKITKKIWAKTITSIKDNKNEWYDIPKGITAASINSISGDPNSHGFVCYYEKGSEPTYDLNFSNIKDSFN